MGGRGQVGGAGQGAEPLGGGASRVGGGPYREGRGLCSGAWPRVTGVIPAGRAAGTAAPARPVSAGKKPIPGSGSEFPGLHRPSLRRSPFSVSISFLFLDELPGSACGTPAGDPRRHGFPLLLLVPSRPRPSDQRRGRGQVRGQRWCPLALPVAHLSGPQALRGPGLQGSTPGDVRETVTVPLGMLGSHRAPTPSVSCAPDPPLPCSAVLRVFFPAVCKSPACRSVEPELPPVHSTQ